MISGWMLPFAEDLFQVVRRGPKAMRGFFRKENLGFAGAAALFGKGAKRGEWLKHTFVTGPRDFTYGGVWPFMLPMAAYLGGKAGQGQSFSTAAGFMASALPGGLGAMIAGGPGALVAGALFSEKFSHGVRTKLHNINMRERRQRAFEMGDPRFEDTPTVYTMRQAAVAEMGGSLLNARQVLGREAALFHS